MKLGLPKSAPTVELRDERVFFSGAHAGRMIIPFLGDSWVTVIEKGAGKTRMLAAIDCGSRCAGSSEQMGTDIYTDCFAGDLRDQDAKVLGRQSLAGR